eukprot:2304542-Pyramimonas_sp.AAC.1
MANSRLEFIGSDAEAPLLAQPAAPFGRAVHDYNVIGGAGFPLTRPSWMAIAAIGRSCCCHWQLVAIRPRTCGPCWRGAKR